MAAKRNLTPEDRKRRSELMKRLNAERRCGGHFGRLGGRPRSTQGETKEEARARRRAEFEQARKLVGQPKPLVTFEAQQKPGHVAKTDDELQLARAFQKNRQTTYRSEGWRV